MIFGLSSFLKRNRPFRIHNIETLKRNINRTSMLTFLAIFVFTIFSMDVINSAYNASKKQLASQEIYSSIETFKLHLSEKLSIIASSSLFIDYLHSGFASREHLSPAFLSLMYTLKSKPLIGMEIHDANGQLIFQGGKTTQHVLKLNICYLYQTLNPTLGDCDYIWSLYFNKNDLLNAITSSNPTIKACTNCQPTAFSDKTKFGSFNVSSVSNLSLPLIMVDKNNYIFYTCFTLMVILVLFLSLLSWLRLNHLFNNHIVTPIDKLTTALKHDIALNQTENNIDEIQLLIEEISAWRSKHLIAKELEQKSKLAQISAQLAHDIRSPVATMRIILRSLSDIPDSHKTILHNCIENINEIADAFLKQYANRDETGLNLEMSSMCISPLLQTMIAEKQTQYQEHHSSISYDVPQNFTYISAMINTTEFKRLISNLINNAFEAMIQPGNIQVTMDTFGQYVRLTITDTGKGIPAHLLNMVAQGGLSVGKQNGNGLGISHAKKMIEAWNGSFELQSVEGVGTTVSIMLPRVS